MCARARQFPGHGAWQTFPARRARYDRRVRRIMRSASRSCASSADARFCRSRMLGELRKRFVFVRPCQSEQLACLTACPAVASSCSATGTGNEDPTSCLCAARAPSSNSFREDHLRLAVPPPRRREDLSPSAELAQHAAARARHRALWKCEESQDRSVPFEWVAEYTVQKSHGKIATHLPP